MTHVESGSLSLFPKPGILKALARLFLLFSDTREDRYSSNPTGPFPHTYNTVFNEFGHCMTKSKICRRMIFNALLSSKTENAI